MIPFLELASQFNAVEADIREAVDRVLARSWFILGEELDAFEKEFAEYVGVGFAVGAGSGTDAIQLALMAAGVGPGDEVVAPANTCVPTVSAIVSAGARPVLADVDDETLTIDPERVAHAITERTKAVVPVHLYGQPCRMDAILAVADSRGLTVVEDAAQAHGARFEGRMCGALGTLGAFSFYPSKNLGAYGDGGAVTTNDEALAVKLRQLRNYGETERYVHTIHGVNSRLDELQAAILRVKLRHLNAWNDKRRALAHRYMDLLAGAPVTLPAKRSWADPNFHLFVVRTDRRDALRTYLHEHGVQALMHYPVPVHLQPAFRQLGYVRGDFPVAERACDSVLSLPLYPELSEAHVERIAECVLRFFDES